MRIGLDIDGVLANFFTSYELAFIKVTGRDLFGYNRWPNYVPVGWDWPTMFGYTDQETSQVWSYIIETKDFWVNQGILPGLVQARRLVAGRHDLYFITDRPGKGAKFATEWWLRGVGRFDNPTVLISRNGKGPIVAGLGLEIYIDDKVENILSVQECLPECHAYLAPIYPYSENHPKFRQCLKRFLTVKEVFQHEKL